ncbi:hypothetical protein CALCODRAFT_555942 [Calocera cornea HHB12733]|uniref:Uncharacterized protein n=1 Tax=Calocera cornea HHB12733 TaxID=1353952 RepID=A0A165F9H3_9BASI|nr:hypothetical protein CALCODRAFT_555942 [Calocera cornea HHB12733]
MYRFRKKSDAQRPRVVAPPPNTLPPIDAVLPPASDFRTSLILPSLTRRFTLLRMENGDRVPLQDIKERLLQRRAQAVDQLTEEEEDLVLEMLGNARLEENRTGLESLRGTTTASTSPTSDNLPLSPTSSSRSPRSSNRSNNRRSNNLFGSHVNYPLPARRSRPSTVVTQNSAGGSDSQEQVDDGGRSAEFPSAGNLDTPLPRSPDFLSASTSVRMNRVSRALEQVLDEIESQDIPFDIQPTNLQQRSGFGDDNNGFPVDWASPAHEHRFPETALHQHLGSFSRSTDAQLPQWASNVSDSSRVFSPEILARAGSVSPPPVAGDPARRIPGYIPGMNRPITPRREVEAKDMEHTSPTSSRPAPLSSSPNSLYSREVAMPVPRPTISAMLPDGPALQNVPSVPRIGVVDSRERDPNPLSELHYGSQLVVAGSSRYPAATPATTAVSSTPYAQEQAPARGSLNVSVRKRARASVSSSPKSISRRQSPSVSEEPGVQGRAFPLSDAWSSGDEGQRLSKRELTSRSPTSNVQSRRTPPPDRWHAVADAESPGPWVASASSSTSSRANQGRLALSSRFSTSSSSLSLGSSYHSSTDNLLAARQEKRALLNSFQGDFPSRWDAGIPGGKATAIDNDIHIAARSLSTVDYEEALKTLGITPQEVYALQARLLQSLDANQASPLPSHGAADNRRQRRSSTPYSVRSAFSGEDTEAGMATESTVTPKRAQHAPNPFSPVSSPSRFISPASTPATKLSRADALLASVLESLPISQTPSGPFGTATTGPTEPPSTTISDVQGITSTHEGLAEHASAIKHGDAGPMQSARLATPPLMLDPTSLGNARLATPPHARPRPDDPELLRDVERQTAAATAFLKKSPSLPKLAEKNSGARRPFKRINPQHIGNPQLLSSSTSNDHPGLPLSPSMTSISQQDKPVGLLRRLRNSVKAKPPVSSDEDHFRTSPKTPPLPVNSRAAMTSPQYANASDRDDWKGSSGLVSPPPTGQIGLKGFMARLRRSKREQDSGSEISPPSTTAGRSPQSPSFAQQQQNAQRLLSSSLSTPATNKVSSSGGSGGLYLSDPKPSLSSPGGPTRHNSAPPTHTVDGMPGSSAGKEVVGAREILATTSFNRMDHTEDPQMLPDIRTQNLDGTATQFGRQPLYRNAGPSKQNTLLDVSPSYSLDGRNQIIRRTLIFPENGMLSAEQIAAVRKSIAGHSRLGSSSSNISITRSIRDRAPTPPPNRFSSKMVVGDPLPPVPSLDHSASPVRLRDSGVTGSIPSGDYSRRSFRAAHVSGGDFPDTNIPRDAGFEVLELSNGQVIWSVVDGLRAGISDENDEDDRSSFGSDFSAVPPSRDEAVQLFVRGHKRNESSRGSSISIPSRRRPAPFSAQPRPETKVYFSSTAQISSLIENISRGLESGSFNIVPNDPTSPFFAGQFSVPSGPATGTGMTSDVEHPQRTTAARGGLSEVISHQHNPSVISSESKHWTMEEQLEHTWNAVNSSGS